MGNPSGRAGVPARMVRLSLTNQLCRSPRLTMARPYNNSRVAKIPIGTRWERRHPAGFERGMHRPYS